MKITIYTYRWNNKKKHYDIIPLKGGEAVDSAKTKFNAELKLKFLHEQQEIRRLEVKPVIQKKISKTCADRKPVDTEILKDIYEKGKTMQRFEKSRFYGEQAKILDLAKSTLHKKINRQVLGVAA